jgi:magnesium transporter
MQRIIKSNSDNGFVWIDVLNPTESDLKQLAETYHLHPSALQDVLQSDHLPKVEQFDDLEFAICRYYDIDAEKGADTIEKISRKLAVFYRKDLVLTIHRRESFAYENLIQKYAANNQLNAFEITCKIVKAVLSTYEDPSIKLDAEIDFYESRIFLKKRIPDLLKNLYAIKRKVYLVRKISNLTEEIIHHLAPIAQAQKCRPVFQDLKDYYVKVDTMVESNHEDINSLMNIYLSLSSQRNNEVMRTLTVFTAFFLPTTFIVGLYGMNFEHMPELKHPAGYPAVIGLMIVVTLVIYSWFKRKGWI